MSGPPPPDRNMNQGSSKKSSLEPYTSGSPNWFPPNRFPSPQSQSNHSQNITSGSSGYAPRYSLADDYSTRMREMDASQSVGPRGSIIDQTYQPYHQPSSHLHPFNPSPPNRMGQSGTNSQRIQHGRKSVDFSLPDLATSAGPSTINSLPPIGLILRNEERQREENSMVASPEEEEEDEGSVLNDDDSGRRASSGKGSVKPGSGSKKRRPHATRRRVVQSCSECRRRKIKCDKKFPCGPCVLRNDESKCHEVGMAEKHVNSSPSAYATAADLASVAHRLDALEAALTKSGAVLSSDMDNHLKSIQQDLIQLQRTAKPDQSLPSGFAFSEGFKTDPDGTGRASTMEGEGGERHSRGGIRDERSQREEDAISKNILVDDTEGAALTLEHLAFGRARVEGSHALPHFGTRHNQGSVSKHVENNDYHLSSSGHRPSFPTQNIGGDNSPSGNKDRVPSIGNSGSVYNPYLVNTPEEDQKRRRSSIVIDPALVETDMAREGENQKKRKFSSTNDPIPKRNKDENSKSALAGGGKEILNADDYESRKSKITQLMDLLGPTEMFDLLYWKNENGANASKCIGKVLPIREKGELLVKNYLEKVDWLHRCLHVPTFLRQCQDLWNLPYDVVIQEISLPFVGLYFAVCCLGMQFMDIDEAQKEFTPEEIRTLPDLWFNAARSTMWASDFLALHEIEHLQSLILLSVFMNNRDRAEAAWALLGAAIKMAQGLGLSRLGAEQQSVDGKPLPMWTGRWESLIQRETGRRIWWNLVWLDWAQAPLYNFNYSIHPDQIKTALPSNIDDIDIRDDQPFLPKPMIVRTRMSFTLARLKFAEITHRQISQAHTQSHLPYSFILSVDAELRRAMMELPSFFQPDSTEDSNSTSNPQSNSTSSSKVPTDPKGKEEYYEKIMLSIAIHSRMLRLHRPWLSRGYTDEKFLYSKEQCIRAARATLRIMSDRDGVASFLEKWWIPLLYVSVSGLVVIIDLLRTNRKDMNSTETKQKINEVKGALDQMRQIADISHPSRAAVKVMDFLLAEVEERQKPSDSRDQSKGKRKSSLNTNKDKETEKGKDGEDDGLQEAVKKLIRQAQLEADSPSNNSNSVSTPSSQISQLPRLSSGSPLNVQGTPKDRNIFDAYPLQVPNEERMAFDHALLPSMTTSSGTLGQLMPVGNLSNTSDGAVAGPKRGSLGASTLSGNQSQSAPSTDLTEVKKETESTSTYDSNNYHPFLQVLNPFAPTFPIKSNPETNSSSKANLAGKMSSISGVDHGTGNVIQNIDYRYMPYPSGMTPSLDPQVESFLSSYFPEQMYNNNNNNNNNSNSNSNSNNNQPSYSAMGTNNGGNNNNNNNSIGNGMEYNSKQQNNSDNLVSAYTNTLGSVQNPYNMMNTGDATNQGGNGGNNINQSLSSYPDDFLSRVFSFSWDTVPGGIEGQAAAQQAQTSSSNLPNPSESSRSTGFPGTQYNNSGMSQYSQPDQRGNQPRNTGGSQSSQIPQNQPRHRSSIDSNRASGSMGNNNNSVLAHQNNSLTQNQAGRVGEVDITGGNSLLTNAAGTSNMSAFTGPMFFDWVNASGGWMA